MALTLVRHAKPLVDAGLCYGALDVAADPEATASVALSLAQSLTAGSHVYFSPLARCAQLSNALQTLRPELDYASEPGIREMNFGAWEGLRWGVIDPSELRAWTDDFAHYRCGGSGESTSMFIGRVYQALHNVGGSTAPDAHTVWITHAGVMRAIVWLRQQGFLTQFCCRSSQAYDPARWDAVVAADWPLDALGFGQCWQLELTGWP
jgi:alpha-ribazole phosphatase